MSQAEEMVTFVASVTGDKVRRDATQPVFHAAASIYALLVSHPLHSYSRFYPQFDIYRPPNYAAMIFTLLILALIGGGLYAAWDRVSVVVFNAHAWAFFSMVREMKGTIFSPPIV